MNDKMVFFDIDGTLLDHDKAIPPSTKEAIFSLQEQGVHVAIATGRAPFMFKELREELGIQSYVSFNGQYVEFEGEVIYKNPLKREVLFEIEKAADKNEHPMVFLDHEDMKSNRDYHTHIDESFSSLKMSHPGHDGKYHHSRDIYQALLFFEEQEDSLYYDRYPAVDFIRWHQFSADIIPKGGSKAKGIERMISLLKVKKENVYAFGDGLNDLEMLRFAGTGIAMGNAVDSVKNAADFVTRDVADDGIVFGLKQAGFILNYK